jgi:hypothetical protein
MSDSLADLLATDAALDRIACREGDCSDHILSELSLFAAALDDVALPPVVPGCARAPMASVRKGGWALTVTVALMVTSSGVAAAVSDDPLGPLQYVTKQVMRIGPHSGGKLPGWQLDGAMPITTVPGVGHAVHGAHGIARGASDSGDGAPGFSAANRLGTPDAHLAGRPGAAVGRRVGSRPGSGSGFGRSPGTSGDEPHGINARTPPPGGHLPSNSPGGSGNSGPTVPENPRRPHRPGHDNQGTQPASGRVPGSAGGHCRVDTGDVPGVTVWSGPPSILRPCHPVDTRPSHPMATSPGSAPAPGTMSPAPTHPDTEAAPSPAASSAPAPRASSSAPTQATSEVSGLSRWIP